MTVFDRLEAQLLDAHAQRNRRALPRPAPRHLLAFAAAAAAAIVIVIAGLSGGSSTKSAGPAAQPGAAVPAIVPADTNVAVINGAGSRGLAKRVAARLIGRGWHITSVTNYPRYVLHTSYVEFAPDHALAASRVADELGIGQVASIADDIRRLAGPQADLAVVLGADYRG